MNSLERSGGWAGFALALCLGFVSPAPGRCDHAAADSSTSAATPSTAAAVIDSPATHRNALAPAPTNDDLHELAWRCGDRRVRAWLGRDGYDIRHPGFGADGVSFGSSNERGVPAREGGAARGDVTVPPPVASPIAWDRIDRIEVRYPSGLRGALIGAVALPSLWMISIAAGGDWNEFIDSGSDGEMARFIVLEVGAVTGAVIGAGFGVLVPHTERVWPRPGAPQRRNWR